MKKLLSFLMLGVFLMIFGCQKDLVFDAPEFKSDTPITLRNAGNGLSDEVEEMVVGGVNWLLEQRNGDGSFSSGQEIVARTAMAVVKLCDRSIEMGFPKPLADGAPYKTQIQSALEFIISHAQDKGFEQKLYNIVGNEHHDNYNGTWALMAFCATRDPGYLTIAQEAANFFIANQAPNGGWGYNAEGGWDDNQNWQDNSNTGYVVLALVAARNFGCTVAPSVVDKMGVQAIPENWIDMIQDDASGGSTYSPQHGNPWINMLKTGNLLFEMAFVGDDMNTLRAQQAVGYLETHWNDPNEDPGFRPTNYQAMYTMMKGFTALGIETTSHGDWYAEFVDLIEATKHGAPGMYYWPSATWTDEYLSTIFALLTLEKIVELPNINVYLDIKPTSCPNPFNMNANGVLPVAILGTADFDVEDINASTILLEGVEPIRWDYEDVAAPVVDPVEACECTTAGPDGYVDLTLKFERQAIAGLLSDVSDGAVVELTISGETVDGVAIIGGDCIVIRKKGK